MARLAAGVDVGGSHVSAGVVDEGWRILARRGAALDGSRSPEDIAGLAAGLVRDCLDEVALRGGVGVGRLEGVGIGVPGLVRQPSQAVAIAPNLGWREVDLLPEFRRAFNGLSDGIAVDNDSNIAAFGEWAAGAGRGRRVVACITLGTGIGCGFVVDGRVFHGASGFAGEIGHVKVAKGGPPCGCGGRGCLETFSSGTAIARAGSEALGREVTAREVFDAARGGDDRACRVIAGAARYLGTGLSILVNLLDPDIIVLGGAVALAGEMILRPSMEEMRRQIIAPTCPGVVTAVLGTEAAIIGGAALFLRKP